MIDLTRRELLIAGAIGSMALSLRSLTPKLATADAGTPAAAEPPRRWVFAESSKVR